MGCHTNLSAGRLSTARRYADALAALPFFREQRHIGVGRRMMVDFSMSSGNAVAASIVERARRLAAQDREDLADIAGRFAALDCPHRSDRTRLLATTSPP